KSHAGFGGRVRETDLEQSRHRARARPNTFGWISKHRRCVRDYETKPDHHEAMIHIAMIMTMSRRLARTGNW
ncbi:hypothetical protein ABZ071_36170, partial [Micromonospora fulviviridis]